LAEESELFINISKLTKVSCLSLGDFETGRYYIWAPRKEKKNLTGPKINLCKPPKTA